MTHIIWHATSDFYPAFFNESYVNFWEFCVCLHSNIGLVLSSGEVNSTLFLWKPLDISLVQKLENAGWMSSQIKIWLINVWVNLIKLLAVHSRTPSDFINIQKFKANLIVAFPSSFIWPWIRTGFILTLPHRLQIRGQWCNWTKLQLFIFTFFYANIPITQILKTRKPLVYMQILLVLNSNWINSLHCTSKNLRYCINEVDFLIFVQNKFLLIYTYPIFIPSSPFKHTLKS